MVSSFAVLGVLALVLTHAATAPTSSIEPENGTNNGNASFVNSGDSSGGSYVQFGFRRFFADDASWNKTISQMNGEFTQLKPYAGRLWDYGGGTTSGSPAGNFYLDFKTYSVPIYDMSTATTTARVFQAVWSQNQQAFSFSGFKIGDTIPWNPNWLPPPGNDGIMAAVDYSTGKVYEFWGANQSTLSCYDIWGPNAQAGFNGNDPAHNLCMASVGNYDNLWTATDGTTIVSRGMGINKLALVVRADEVAHGNATNQSIGHALPLTTANPMFGAGIDTPGIIAPTFDASGKFISNGSDPLGNGMVNPKDDPLQPGAGTTKGFYVKPATRLELQDGYIGGSLYYGEFKPAPPTDIERAKTVPSGMRFGLSITESDITAWLNAKGYTGVKRQTAATFARTWRDYGAIVAETGGYGIGIETDSVINPVSAAKWSSLGVPVNNTDMQSEIDFSGLITRDRLYVVKTPQ